MTEYEFPVGWVLKHDRLDPAFSIYINGVCVFYEEHGHYPYTNMIATDPEAVALIEAEVKKWKEFEDRQRADRSAKFRAECDQREMDRAIAANRAVLGDRYKPQPKPQTPLARNDFTDRLQAMQRRFGLASSQH